MILSRATADKKLRRMALQVAEKNYTCDKLILIGIKENGIFIAHKIAAYLKENFSGSVQVLSLSLDKKNPSDILLSEEIDFHDTAILLIDDVANSGRTMLYALKPLLKFHPRQIETLALVERTHKQFPVAVDYVGLSISTAPHENIVVEVEKGVIMGARIG